MADFDFDNVNTIANDLPSGTVTKVALFEADANFGAGDTIGLANGIPVPKNAVILDVTVIAPELEAGGTATFDVGDSGDVDRFIDAGELSGSATFYRTSINVIPTSTAGVIGSGMGYKYTAEGRIFITVNDTTDVSGGAPIVMIVQYTLDSE